MGRQGKFVASIEARTGSSRLPGKVLKDIAGKPMIVRMIERVRKAKGVDEIVLATSTHPNDQALEDVARSLGIRCFRGSEEDVLSRVVGASQAAGADHIIELWGDTPLMDPAVIDMAVDFYKKNDFDCVGTCLDKVFPWGMSLLVFPAKVLAEVDRITKDPVDREHVSIYIYSHPEKYRIANCPCPENIRRPDIRLTVDEAPDFQLVSGIFEHFLKKGKEDFNTSDIIRFLDEHPEMKNINAAVQQRKPRG